MTVRNILGMILALTLAFSIGAAGEKSQKKAAKDAKGCCAEMTKASSTDAKACEGKDMKASAAGCPAGAKATKAKDCAAACGEKGSSVKASADRAPSAPKASPKDNK
jgi:hypothetical protein